MSVLGRSVAVASLSLCAAFAWAQTAVLEVVSAPNPHVFPLLVALSEHPNLPIHLVAVKGGPDIAQAFDRGADVLLGMTYVGANLRLSGAIPTLELVLPVTWSGFWELAPAGVRSFRDLRGQTVLVSGPVGSGKGGGDDILFRAAVRRQGMDPDKDLHVIYSPIKDAPDLIKTGKAQAIAVPAPASNGLLMQSRMNGGSLGKAIDFQQVFSGYRSFPQGQLPLGGILATARTLGDPDKAASLRVLIRAYAEGARKLKENPMRASREAANAYKEYFGATGAPAPPAMVMFAALRAGDLAYRTNVPVTAVQSDLDAWLTEILGKNPGPSFYAGNFADPGQTGPLGPMGRFRRRMGGN